MCNFAHKRQKLFSDQLPYVCRFLFLSSIETIMIMAFFRPLEVVTSKKLCALLFALLLEHNMLVTAGEWRQEEKLISSLCVRIWKPCLLFFASDGKKCHCHHASSSTSCNSLAHSLSYTLPEIVIRHYIQYWCPPPQQTKMWPFFYLCHLL